MVRTELPQEQIVLEQDKICWDPRCKRVINAGEAATCITGEVSSGYGTQRRRITVKRYLHPGCQGPRFESSLSPQRLAALKKGRRGKETKRESTQRTQ
jgi:hypothetical protein